MVSHYQGMKLQFTLVFKLLSSNCTCNQQNYRELKEYLENQCLKCLHKSELSQTLAYKVTKCLDSIGSKFPKWKALANMHEGSVHLYYMGTSPVIVEYEVIITAELATGSTY